MNSKRVIKLGSPINGITVGSVYTVPTHNAPNGLQQPRQRCKVISSLVASSTQLVSHSNEEKDQLFSPNEIPDENESAVLLLISDYYRFAFRYISVSKTRPGEPRKNISVASPWHYPSLSLINNFLDGRGRGGGATCRPRVILE